MRNYFDVAENGGARVLEQVVEKRKRMHARLEQVERILLVGSGKGGVGKSTLTASLSFAFAHLGYRVSVLDADLNGPSLARMLGMREALVIPGEDGLNVPVTSDGIGVLSLGSLLPEETALEFETLVKGDSFVWRSTREFTALTEILGAAEWGKRDLLIVDLPPGPERTAQFAEFFGKRTSTLLVTIPTDVSRGVVSRAVSALHDSGTNIIGYLENMSDYLCPECNRLAPLFRVSGEVTVPVPSLGTIPFDPQLAQLCDSGLNIERFLETGGSKSVLVAAEKIAPLIDLTIRSKRKVGGI